MAATVDFDSQRQGRRKILKSGGASSNVVGIICPLPVEIGLIDLSKSGGAKVSPTPAAPPAPWLGFCSGASFLRYSCLIRSIFF